MSASKKRFRYQFSVRAMLVVAIPFCIAIAVWGGIYRQQLAAANSFIAMCNKGVDANYGTDGSMAIFFKHSNVTEDDLRLFVNAFNGYGSFPRIRAIRLNGSDIEDDALEEFRAAVGPCDVSH